MAASSFWGSSERSSCDLWNAGHHRYNFLVCSEAEEKVSMEERGFGCWWARDGESSMVFVSSSCCWHKLRAEDGQDLSHYRPALVVTSDAFV